MPTILLLEGAGGRHALHRYRSLLSAGAWATAALLLAQAAPACRLDAQGTTLLPKSKAEAEATAVKQPTAAGRLSTVQNADPDNTLARSGKAAGTVPLCGKAEAENNAAEPAEHRRVMAIPALLPGYGAGGQPTGKAKALPLGGTAAENAAESALLGVTGILPSITERAATAQCGSRGTVFGGTAGSMVGKNAAKSSETAEAAVCQPVEGKAALPLRKTDAAGLKATAEITVLSLAGLSLVPDWEYPVRQGSKLYIPQGYSISRDGDKLELA